MLSSVSMRIALNFVANGARLRANGAREIEIQIAPANTDANAFAACANGANTIESACRAADGPPGDWICPGLLLSDRDALIERHFRQRTGLDLPRLEAECCQITLPTLVENRAIADVHLKIAAERRLL